MSSDECSEIAHDNDRRDGRRDTDVQLPAEDSRLCPCRLSRRLAERLRGRRRMAGGSWPAHSTEPVGLLIHGFGIRNPGSGRPDVGDRRPRSQMQGRPILFLQELHHQWPGIGHRGDSASVGSFTLQFKSPSSLAPGTYSDTLTIEACEDSACQQQIEGSPAKITVNYVVSEGQAPRRIEPSGPDTVVAGGASFQLVLIGSNFDGNSIIQWDGLPQPTGFLSSSLLIAADQRGRISPRVANSR